MNLHAPLSYSNIGDFTSRLIFLSMKISQVLLRWHKSFNINYNSYDDRLGGESPRPWNALHIPGGDPADFGFIEIPLEADITTIVGANESGKSHLLDAVCKVLTGEGNDDRPASADEKAFSVTDLCHFASVRSKDSDVWPNIGLRFSDVSEGEARAILNTVVAVADATSVETIRASGFVLILAPTSEDLTTVQAYLYFGDQSLGLVGDKLAQLRLHLPRVHFLRSNLPLVDEISLPTLISAFGGVATYEAYEANSIHAILSALRNIAVPPSSQQDNGFAQQIENLKQQAEQARLHGGQAGQLEAMLFRDVLETV